MYLVVVSYAVADELYEVFVDTVSELREVLDIIEATEGMELSAVERRDILVGVDELREVLSGEDERPDSW